MSYKLLRNLLEPLVAVMLILGIVTAAIDVTFGGFTPIIWFLIASIAILLIICTEVTQVREFLEKKK